MRKTVLIALSAVLSIGVPAVDQAAAQEGPGSRYVTATSFSVPFPDRGVVFPFMEEYFLPNVQLNPNVRSFRVMWHNWGSDATQVILVAEYDSWDAIQAECGQPCRDYYAQHEPPEEGEEGWEEYDEAQRTFAKYYAHHRDEIYFTPMGQAVVEGEMMGTVGPDPEGDQ